MNAEGKVLNNDFFGGNIRGILEKLDYLQSLHVTVLYLNPIFRSFSNHRYDTGNFMEIDPTFGTEEEFARLVEECRKRGIRIMLDGVFNHTGDDSLYFNKYGRYPGVGAYQSKDSKYYAWYNFIHYPEKYSAWWGIDNLPAVNEECPSYADYITGENGVIRYWLKYSLGGFRLDVADELPDEFIEKIRQAVKAADPEAVVLGEVWEDASNKIAYSKRRKYFWGKELDSVMNYPLKDAIIQFILSGDTSLFRQTVAMLRDNYPKSVLDSLMNILGTHDTARILTALGGVHAYTKDEMSYTKLSESGPPHRKRSASRRRRCCCSPSSAFPASIMATRSAWRAIPTRSVASRSIGIIWMQICWRISAAWQRFALRCIRCFMTANIRRSLRTLLALSLNGGRGKKSPSSL